MAALTQSQRALLLALAARIVPESCGLDPGEQARMLALIDEELSDRPAGIRRQFALFLNVLQWAPAVRYGRRFSSLAPARQDAVLLFFQDFPIQIVRSGFWGVRTLVLMGYYARPAIGSAIHYFPATNGNAVLHARTER